MKKNGVSLLASVGLVAAFSLLPGSVAAQEEDCRDLGCWGCEDFWSLGMHNDYADRTGDWCHGGPLHNGTTAGHCVSSHDFCEETEEVPDLLALATAVRLNYPETVREFMAAFPKRVVLDMAERSIWVKDCGGHPLAFIPAGIPLLTAVSAIAAPNTR